MAERWNNYRAVPDPYLSRSLAVLLLALLLVGATGWGAREVYLRTRYHLYCSRAEAAMDRKDWKQAAFYLRINYNRDPDNLRGTRLMVRLGKELHSPWIEQWRLQLQKLAPEDVENNLGLAGLDLKRGQVDKAKAVAENLKTSATQGPSAENLLAIIALRENKIPEAKEHFLKARKGNPESAAITANYLGFLITSAPESPDIPTLLEELATLPGGKDLSSRCRIAWLLKKEQKKEALELAARLAGDPKGKFSDTLAYLSLCARFEPRLCPEILNKALADAAKTPETSNEMTSFLTANHQHQKALQFLAGLPPEIKNQPALRKKEADILRQSGDWKQLQNHVQGPSWDQDEPQRLAYLAEALTHGPHPEDARPVKQSLLLNTKGKPFVVFDLLRLVAAWPGWEGERESLLWELAKTPAFEPNALKALFAIYESQGNTIGLQRTADQLLVLEPDNLGYQNNAISLALLNGIKDKSAQHKAFLMYGSHPDNLFVISTYAFALLKEGKSAEALTVFSRIPEPARYQAPFNFYYGLILHANKDHEEGRRAWSGVEWKSLLDQEKKLWQEQQDSVASPGTNLSRPPSSF